MKKLFLYLILSLSFLSVATAALDQNVLIYYSFDNSSIIGSNIDDLSEHQDATNNGATTGIPGVVNQALRFDGTSDYLDLTGLSSSTGTYSFSFWANVTNEDNRYLFDTAGGRILITMRGNAVGNNIGILAGPSWKNFGIQANYGQWDYYTFLVNTTNAQLYRNGVFVATTTYDTRSISGSTVIAKDRNSADNFYKGMLDEFAIWNRTLTPVEISNLYNGGTGLQYPFVSESGYFNITAESNNNGQSISTFNATVTYIPEGGSQMTDYYTTTNGTIVVNGSNFSGDVADITVDSVGYQSKTYINHNTGSFLNAKLQDYSYLELVFRNESLDLVTSPINITVQNSTHQWEYNTSTGYLNVSKLNINKKYLLLIDAEGYLSQTAAFTRTTNLQTPYQIILSNETSNVTFIIQAQNTTAVANAIVKVSRFINGSYQEYTSGITDVTGSISLNVRSGVTNKIEVSANGYLTNTFNSPLTSSQYLITLNQDNTYDFDGGQDGVTVFYSPTNATLIPDLVTFNMSVKVATNDLDYISIRLYNGSKLISQNSTSFTGDSFISLKYNLSAYNNSNVYVRYVYKKQEFSEKIIYKTYFVTDQSNYDGSLKELRTYMIDNVDIFYRITLWTIITFTFMLCISLILTGASNILASTFLGLIIGYAVGIDLFVLGGFAVIITVITYSYGRGY